MDPIVLTAIIASVIGIAFALVVVFEILKRKKGKPTCGGSCSGCPCSCGRRQPEKEKEE